MTLNFTCNRETVEESFQAYNYMIVVANINSTLIRDNVRHLYQVYYLHGGQTTPGSEEYEQ